ncbi:podocalyxin [Xiphophorus maculatus]|uniref:Podocalyxin n=1 Tax=Xiphophorus maculatus TaxID=8083 RepID=A0A3B5Q7W9_XIPMA|nr:podocalyxin [Xiphophorus maculatus]
MRATLTVTWLLLSLSICSESSNVSSIKPLETEKSASTTSGLTTAPASPASSNQSEKPTSVAPSTGTMTQQQPTTVITKPPTTATALTTATTAQSNTNAQISVISATSSGAITPSATTVTTAITTVIPTSATGFPASNSKTELTTATESSRGTTASALKPSESAVKKTNNTDAPTADPPVRATSQRSQATLTTAGSNESNNAGPTTQTMTTPSNSNQVPERSFTSSQTPTVKDSHVITKSLTTADTTQAGGTETNTETFMFSLSDSESAKNKTLVQLCKSIMSSLRNGTCLVTLLNNGSKIGSLKIEVDFNLVQEQLSKLNAEIKPAEEPTDNKTLTAILASCGALLIMIIILGVCVSQRRKPYNENQLHLTEELHTVENGYHDNPTLEVMEVQPEMQEKKMALNGEFSDSWIVPIDNLMKEDAPDEEDTHL